MRIGNLAYAQYVTWVLCSPTFLLSVLPRSSVCFSVHRIPMCVNTSVTGLSLLLVKFCVQSHLHSLVNFAEFQGKIQVRGDWIPLGTFSPPLSPSPSLSGLVCGRISWFPNSIYTYKKQNKINSVAWVHKRTVPTEGPPLVGEFSANFCG
jgi:hypothetical protein